MSTTSLTAGNMIAAIVQWFILLVLLRVYVYKPLSAAMQRRKDNIAKQIQDADSLREQAQQLHDEQESLVRSARDDAKSIIAAARREGEEQAKKIIEAAQREASYRQKAALDEIQHERDMALSEIRGQVADLVLMATGKLLERNISDEDQHRLVEEFLNQAGSVQ
ncbi:MAG: F0F1 ATP synthase subunit B [Firmicutes bacterium]|nr:F0F1 ATP synthase subunit B [Bacillota bacterium]